MLVVPVGVLARRLMALRTHRATLRPILLVLLVELRSGLSVLAALQSVARRFPEDPTLGRAVGVATVSGIDAGAISSDRRLYVLLGPLARAQRSGASAADVVRRLLESDMAAERATQLAKTKALPVKLMIPLTLLTLPGVLILGYGPTLVSLLSEVVSPLG